ncbi:MAG: hypothetical protein J6A74_00945 [Oscillospiraceae bacterium]|nr:hypothetical protein [Oscillospiraceae bacterium]
MDDTKFEFTAFIENLNRRTRGFISGAHLTFPTTTELVQATLNIIGVDGLRNRKPKHICHHYQRAFGQGADRQGYARWRQRRRLGI